MKALCLLILLLFTCNALLVGQSDSWDALSEYESKKITVSTRDGQQRSGKLFRIEEERIVLEDGGVPVPLARSSVQTISRERSRNKAGWIAGLSAAGFALGFIIGFRAFEDATHSERKIGTAALAGAGAGAAIGYAISRGGRKQELVYQAPCIGNPTWQAISESFA